MKKTMIAMILYGFASTACSPFRLPHSIKINDFPQIIIPTFINTLQIDLDYLLRKVKWEFSEITSFNKKKPSDILTYNFCSGWISHYNERTETDPAFYWENFISPLFPSLDSDFEIQRSNFQYREIPGWLTNECRSRMNELLKSYETFLNQEKTASYLN